jgi:hypothetical protein
MIVELILDSDGNHFLFSPIFDRTPVSRDLDCYSLAKVSEILAGADILSDANICDVFCMAGRPLSRYNAGENPPIKAVQPATTAHLVTTCGGINTFWEKWENISEVREMLRTLPGQNSKKMLPHMRQHFVEANILSTPTFCQRKFFCRRQHFLDVNILSTPTFCRR